MQSKYNLKLVVLLNLNKSTIAIKALIDIISTNSSDTIIVKINYLFKIK